VAEILELARFAAAGNVTEAAMFTIERACHGCPGTYELAVERAPVPNRHVADALRAMSEIYEECGEESKALDLVKRALTGPARRHGLE
jgi:hypothetical protein